MKTQEMIRYALDMGDMFIMTGLDELADAPLTFPGTRGGCHPMWVMGHLAYVEGDIRGLLFGEPNPLEHWKKHFGARTEPTADAADYPPFAEVVDAYQRLHAENVKRAGSLTQAELDAKPANPPAGVEHVFPTVGATFVFLALHAASHRGQLADARRARGLQPALG